MEIRSDNPEHGFQFPGVFEIAAIGNAGLEAIVPRLLAEAGVAVVEGSVSMRAASGGRYVSVRLRFHAEDRGRYEAAHTALRGHPDVKWTL